MCNLQNGMQFETIISSDIENGDFKHKHYRSICIAVLLAVHVFDCDVTGDSGERATLQCYHLWIFYSIAPMNTKCRMNIHETGKRVPRLDFYSTIHIVFPRIFLLHCRVFEVA